MKVGDVICVANFHDLCPRLSPRRSFGESWHNGIWAFLLATARAIVRLSYRRNVRPFVRLSVVCYTLRLYQNGAI